MIITGISGSPTSGGNNEKVIDLALDIAKENGYKTDKILLSKTKVSFCERRNGLLLKGKVGGAIAVGGARNGGQEFTINAIHSWMHIHGMIVVGDMSHFGGIALKPVESDDAGLKTVKDTVNLICETLARFK